MRFSCYTAPRQEFHFPHTASSKHLGAGVSPLVYLIWHLHDGKYFTMEHQGSLYPKHGEYGNGLGSKLLISQTDHFPVGK